MLERHYLVGTAGHVDHGKTQLIRALTGIETDRLKEEKQRGISIELGFAHMKLPSGKEVGIVDVPGHEKFVRQMLAGASGMDLVLLVIAADEGIMPQTKEHLDILNLLGVSRGIVVLNKVDLVDSEWLELIEEEIKEELKGSTFENSPICPVSAITGQGIPVLLEAIDKLLLEVECKKIAGPVRMPIDRVFSIQGFGTVVTGTLHSGKIIIGQELSIEPFSINTKVRTLQVHGHKVGEAYAGQRVAVNVAGIEVGQVEHGSVLVMPHAFHVGKILDLKINNLSKGRPMQHRQRVRFHLGTSEIFGRIHLLAQDELLPGQEGYAQILLESPVLAGHGDRFVLRSYSPAHTIAGGKILGVADYKLKRFREQVLSQLRLKDQGDPIEIIKRELKEPKTCQNLEKSLGISEQVLLDLLNQAIVDGTVIELNEDVERLYWDAGAANEWYIKIAGLVRSYTKEYVLRGGVGREELKSRLGIKWTNRRWQMILELGAEKNYYQISGSKVKPAELSEIPEPIKRRLSCMRKRLSQGGLMPPDLDTIALECGVSKQDIPEYAAYLCDEGDWIQISNLYFSTESFSQAKESLTNFLKEHKEVSVAQVREIWSTSRKFAVPLLEYFDQKKITKREGDKRVLF
ncbi:MAG: selenocysteine-specific translation elongation factor [Desulfitobacterium hafniense]|nr:selenocysteine-specific translation elongation factor [Desulfitobacterium hafniense]